MTEQEVRDALKRCFQKEVRSGPQITLDAMNEVLGAHTSDKEWIKDNFSLLVDQVQSRAYEKYLEEERPAAAHAFREVLGPLLSDSAGSDDFFAMLQSNFWALDRFFLGLTQGRKPRAGNAFEHVIKSLFDTLGYPYASQPIINGQPDFLLPSLKHWRANAMDCLIFTVKRTLRERWRQITTEGTRGHMFFLATVDDKVAKRDLPDMLAHRIYLVMPESLRAEKYPDIVNVISFEKFFDQHLDPAMSRWRSNGVIPEV